VPVLAGSAAYAIAEAMGWPGGLEVRANDARGFYGVIAVSMIAGLGLGFTPINPIKALFYSAVINGVVAVPLTVLILLLAMRPAVLGAYTASRSSLVLGWITVLLMAGASVGMMIPA
jgi:Mn2+/Fe2+ NRAMP family transporter